MARREATLHLNSLPDETLYHMLQHLHHLLNQLQAPVIASIQSIPFALGQIDNEAFLPGSWVAYFWDVLNEITHLNCASFLYVLQHLSDNTWWSSCFARSHLADSLCDHLQADRLALAFNWAFLWQVFWVLRELNIEKTLASSSSKSLPASFLIGFSPMTSWLCWCICLARWYTDADLASIFWRAALSASLLAWCTTRFDVRLAVLYAARLPPAFHNLKYFRFSLASSSTWLYHHHIPFLNGWFKETLHTYFVPARVCPSVKFNTHLLCLSVLVQCFVSRLQRALLAFSGSLSFHTLMCCLGWGGVETLKSPTSSLCCDAPSFSVMTK